MNLIKLNAIDSTNDYLKSLKQNQDLPNFTTVMAEYQTKGKGQMGSNWNVEAGKNLTFSVLLKHEAYPLDQIWHVSMLVSCAIHDALSWHKIPNLTIKWPNDIMSDSFKIGGILIENTIRYGSVQDSIVGIGLNVNQLDFDNLPKASSIAKLKNQILDKDTLLMEIVHSIRVYFAKALTSQDILKMYNQLLFKKSVPMPFQVGQEKPFMGIIERVTSNGQLVLKTEDDLEKYFSFKEIKMLY